MICALALLVLSIPTPQKWSDQVPEHLIGRPPVTDQQKPSGEDRNKGLINAGGDSRSEPDGDDVQVSSPSDQNQNETVISVDPLDRNHLIGGANDSRNKHFTTCAFYASLDGGRQWNELIYQPNEYVWAGDPAVVIGPNGETYFCAIEWTDRSAIYVGRSLDGGITVPQWVRAVGDDESFEDKDFITADRTRSPLSGALYISWTRAGSGDAGIRFIASFDQSLTWSSPVRVSDSNSCTGSCVAVGPGGEIYVSYFDFGNRIMVDRSLDGGLTWGTDVFVTYIDTNLENTPFQAPCFTSMDVDTSGGPYNGTVYIPVRNYDRAKHSTDILLYRSTDSARTWIGPVLVSDDTDNSSQFFPWIDVDDNGNVNVGFHDRRGPGPDRKISYWVARSSDGGASFQPNVQVADQRFDPFSYADGTFIGHYSGLAASDRTVHPLWTDGRNNTHDIFTSRVELCFHSDKDQLPVSTGGQVRFTLNAGPLYQNADYFVFGSLSGTSPGLDFGSVNLPLNLDAFFLLTATLANSATFQNFTGTLDATGSSFPLLDSGGPIDPALSGIHLDFAALVHQSGNAAWASSATGLDLVP